MLTAASVSAMAHLALYSQSTVSVASPEGQLHRFEAQRARASVQKAAGHFFKWRYMATSATFRRGTQPRVHKYDKDRKKTR